MRVLILAPQVPWPTWQGTAIRNYHIARIVARHHTVTLLAFGDPAAMYPPLTAAGIQVIAVPPPKPRSLYRRFVDLWSDPVPDLARRLDAPGMWAHVMAASRQRYDVVQVEGFEMAPYGLAFPRAGGHPRLLYDAHNAEWVLQDRAWRAALSRVRSWPGAGYSLLQTWKIRRYEGRLLRSADAAVAVSEADAAAIRPLAPSAPVAVVPNGVDTDAVRPAEPALEEPGLCVFVGKMDFRPNIDAVRWFVDSGWPRVRAGRPDARLAIVGRDPTPAVRALACDHVTVTGAVADVGPWLARAAVIVVPLRIGGGTRLKVLEAMAAGKAIAATRVAVEGLHVQDGVEVRVGNSPPELAGAVLELLADPAGRRELGMAARRRAEAEYRWEALVPGIEALYR